MDTETMNTEIDASNAEARIEDVYFLTLQLAFDAAQNGDTVTLVRDVPLPTIASCEADLTLDLHGHQIFKHTISFTGNVEIRDSEEGGAIISDVSNGGTMKNYAKIAGVLTNRGHLMNNGTIDKLVCEDGVTHNTGVIHKGSMHGGAYNGDLDHISYVLSIGETVYGSLASAVKDANTATDDVTIFVHERSTIKSTVVINNPDVLITLDMNGKTFLNGTIEIDSKVMVIDTSKRKKGNILSSIDVGRNGEFHVESTVSGNIKNEGTVINDGALAGTNSNFGTLINNEEGEVTDTLLSEGIIKNDGEMDYLYVRKGEASSSVNIRNVTVLGGHYQGEVTAVECKAAIGDIYFGDVYEALNIAEEANEDLTVSLYKETKLKEPLQLKNTKAHMSLDIHGQEVSGADINVFSDVTITNSNPGKGSLFNTITVKEGAHLTFGAKADKSMECYGLIENTGVIPYVTVHSGSVVNSGTINKAVLEEGATFDGVAQNINSEAMIGTTHYMTFKEALQAALIAEKPCTLSLLIDLPIEDVLELSPKRPLTFNLNDHNVTGGTLKILTYVILESSGEKGSFECAILNEGTLENNAPVIGNVVNHGKLVNNANMNAVTNTGELTNRFVITSLVEEDGKVTNRGTLSKVSHQNGEIYNEGAIDSLEIAHERVKVEGSNPEHTNANLKIDNAYYTSFEGAIDDMNKSEGDVIVGFVKDLTINEPLTLNNKKANITLALNDHKIDGAKLTIETPVTITSGTVDNDIENHSELINQAKVNGYMRNIKSVENSGYIKRLDNKNECSNSGDIDTLVMKGGSADNTGVIRNLAMAKGSLNNDGSIEVISQKGGAITNTNDVGHLELESGLFKGPLTTTNAKIKIEETYYASFAQAMKQALSSQKNIVVTLIDDLEVNEEITLTEIGHMITLDLNGFTLSGERIMSSSRFTVTNGTIANVLVNYGRLTMDAYSTGDMINDGTMSVTGTCTSALLNKKTLLNNGTINVLNNEGTLTNSGIVKTVTSTGTMTNNEDASLDAVILNAGTLTNVGIIRNVQMSDGTLVNDGELHYINESNGTVTNNGDVDTLMLSGGSYHGPLKSTNAKAHINNDYYATFEAALLAAHDLKEDVTINVIDAVIINNPVTIGHRDHKTTIDVGNASMSGTIMNTIGTCHFISDEGAFKNRIVNKGDLTLEGNMLGAITNEGTLENLGLMASLINNKDAHNAGTINTLTNNANFTNDAIVKKAVNLDAFTNNAHIDELTVQSGEVVNHKFIATAFMNDGLLTNEAKIVALKQLGGRIENHAKVENLDMDGGRYIGDVDVSNAIARIDNVLYARLNEVIEDANRKKGDVTINLRDHAQVLDQLTIGHKEGTITIMTNENNIVGELLTFEHDVVLTGKGKITNGLYNKGHLVSEILMSGECMNEGTLEVHRKVTGTLTNRGDLVNEGMIESLINRANFVNNGSVGAFTQTDGKTENAGLVQDVILDEGKLVNLGTMNRITQKGGEAVNEGTVSTLALSRGTYKGSVEKTNALARIDDTYYPYLENAVEVAVKSQDDVTITLNDDVTVGKDFVLDHPSHLLTLDLNGHILNGHDLTCRHDVVIKNGNIKPDTINTGHLTTDAVFEGSLKNSGSMILNGHVHGSLTNTGEAILSGSANTVTNNKKFENKGIIGNYDQEAGTLTNDGTIDRATLHAGGLINDDGASISIVNQNDGSITNFGVVKSLLMEANMVVFKGNAPETTNSEAKILTNYFRFVAYAIDQANHTREGVKVILNNDVHLDKDILFYNTEKEVILDLNGHTLDGASLTAATHVVFTGEGTIRNRVDVTGVLTNEASLEEDVFLHGELINKGHIAHILCDGEIVNHKNAVIESLEVTKGHFVNHGTIANMHFEEAKGENAGYIQSLIQASGDMVNTGSVKDVTMTAGRFTGPIRSMSSAAHIDETYYGRFDEALMNAQASDEDVTLVLDIDVNIDHELTLAPLNEIVLTIDLHGHQLSGEVLTINKAITFVNTGDDALISNNVINNGTLTSHVGMVGDLRNEGTFINEGAFKAQIDSHREVDNKGYIQMLINDDHVNNSGVIDYLTFDDGKMENSGTLNSAVMKSGRLSNEGTITNFVMNHGEALSTGTVHDLTMTGGVFTGKVEMTNALARIDTKYYPTFEDALRKSSDLDVIHTITLNDDIETKKPVIVNHTESLIIDLDGHHMKGAELTLNNDVRIIDKTKEGTLENALVNKGTLCLQVNALGAMTNTSYFNNHGEMHGDVANNGTITNDGTIDHLINYQRIENNGVIHTIVNNIDLINNKNGRIDEAESKGMIKNDGAIENLTMHSGTMDTSGMVTKIVQEAGGIHSTGTVDLLETTGGHFNGEVKETNAQGSISKTYYATLRELLETATLAEDDVTIKMNKDVVIENDLLLSNKHATLTIDLNGHQMTGQSLTMVKDVVITNTSETPSRVENKITNKGNLKLNVEVSGDVDNDAHLINDGVLNLLTNKEVVINHGKILTLFNKETLENSGHINRLNNMGEATNTKEGQIDLYRQDTGTLINLGSIDDVTLVDGSLSNSGHVKSISQSNGEVNDDGTIDEIILSSGTYNGPKKDLDCAASVEDHYYGTLNAAIDAMNKYDEDVTLTLSNDVFSGVPYVIHNSKIHMTIDLNGYGLHGVSLTIQSPVTIMDSSLGMGDVDVKIINESTLVNDAVLDTDVTNDGTLTNNQTIDTVVNNNLLENKGHIHTLIQNKGESTNEKEAYEIEVNDGAFLNEGHVRSAMLIHGELKSEGTLNDLTLYGGRFEGEADYKERK